MMDFLIAVNTYPWTCVLIALWASSIAAIFVDGLGAYHDRRK